MSVATVDTLSILAANDLLPADRVAAFLTGSLVRGWGNATSDMDAYLVVREPWTRPAESTSRISGAPGEVPVAVFYEGDRRWDVEVWRDEQVDDLLHRVSWPEFEAGRTSRETLTRPDVAFIQRLSHAVAADGEEWVRRRVAEFEASAIRAIIATHALHQLDLLVEDVLGMLAIGDTASATLAARYAFAYAVEALLASEGEFHEQEKWRARRVAAIQPSTLTYDHYWATETMREYDPDAPHVWIEGVLRTCQSIANEVSL